jgi:hypothetical protein
MNKMSMPHKTFVARNPSGAERHGIGGRVLDDRIRAGDGGGVLREQVRGAQERDEKKERAADGFHVFKMRKLFFAGEQNFRSGEDDRTATVRIVTGPLARVVKFKARADAGALAGAVDHAVRRHIF